MGCYVARPPPDLRRAAFAWQCNTTGTAHGLRSDPIAVHLPLICLVERASRVYSTQRTRLTTSHSPRSPRSFAQNALLNKPESTHSFVVWTNSGTQASTAFSRPSIYVFKYAAQPRLAMLDARNHGHSDDSIHIRVVCFVSALCRCVWWDWVCVFGSFGKWEELHGVHCLQSTHTYTYKAAHTVRDLWGQNHNYGCCRTYSCIAVDIVS